MAWIYHMLNSKAKKESIVRELSYTMVDLHGQHVLVTGSAGGIGLEVAKLLLEHGANVSLHYNKSFDTLEPLVEQYPNNTFTFSVNAEDEQAIIYGIEQTYSKFGVINVAIINHAVFGAEDVPIWEMSLEQWNRIINLDLTSYFLYTREWCKQLVKYKQEHIHWLTNDKLEAFNASLILIGSTAGKFGEAKHIDYSTAKGALQSGFIKSLKNEIVEIFPYARCNVVAPGWVETPMAKQSLKDGKHLKTLKTMPMKKIATTQDIARQCLHLADRMTSGHTTGQVLMIDGGMEGRVTGEK
ncbi:unnamed protein product [Didymodactylos carnosus]|uniref:Uncharacterized protein n=1 Tax=Didymodactylos carnosus TaxID=1234261 RepID=A0A813RMW9_9BILA|nr:unnamed protein product [Didymodactylos carnosus]CAF3566802.1 unnamed protein product [Didymodactylos carnosus]